MTRHALRAQVKAKNTTDKIVFHRSLPPNKTKAL